MSDKKLHRIIYMFKVPEMGEKFTFKISLDIVVEYLPDSNFCAGYIVFNDVAFVDDGESLDEEEMSHFLDYFGDHITDNCLKELLNSKEKNSGKNSDTTIH